MPRRGASESAIFLDAAEDSRACSAAYLEYVLSYQEEAEEACNGALVNARGRELGISEALLFSGPGHHMRARAYGTRELHDFLEARPLVTRTAFEASWTGQAPRAAAIAGAREEALLPLEAPVEYLDRRGVADRIGVRPGTLSRYRLPPPDVLVGGRRGWLPATIDGWHAARPRVRR